MDDKMMDFVMGHGIKFITSKRNIIPFEKASAKWEEIYSSLQINENSVILFCGAKNNGKSSLIRYSINQFNQARQLRRNGVIRENGLKVESSKDYAYFVDFDPGQPEMTTPGIISAHVIYSDRQPLRSPTYLNISQHEPIVMSSIGGTNMSVNPKMYIENCRFIMNQVRQHQKSALEKQPIFINTMGYIRNVGLAMLMDLIKSCRPTNLVILNVESDPMRVIYADLSPRAMMNTRAAFYYETTKQIQDLDYKCDIHSLEFSFVDSSSTATKNRTALQLAYFRSIPESLYTPIMKLNPKSLSLANLFIHCVSSYPLKESIVLELLFHSWVHLAKLKRIETTIPETNGDICKDSGSENKFCNMIENVRENRLLGCGIVVDINLDKKMIAIITPLSQETLEKDIDCLIKPLSIQVPQEIIQAPGLQ